jgi:hypothetical protein
MKGILVAAIVWTLCDVGAAFAQVGMGAVTPPLGITSPLGIGPAAPVARRKAEVMGGLSNGRE